MSWIENIRNKSHAQKVRLIWIICGIVVVIMVVVWVFTSKMRQDLPKDTSLFQTISRGIKNLK